jgi:hypothetical protein
MKTVRVKTCTVLSLAIALAMLFNGCKKEESTGGNAGSAGASKETRVPVKTSLPAGADPSQPKVLSFAEFVSIPEPPGVLKNDPRYDKDRIPAFSNSLGVKEGDVVKIRGYLHVVTLMGDGDYNIRLSATADSADNYVVSEIPDDDDIADKKLRPMVIAAREYIKAHMLQGKDASRQGSTVTGPSYVELTGQLFFSDNHVGDAPAPDKQGLHRATSWQIHPGLAVSLVPEPGH